MGGIAGTARPREITVRKAPLALDESIPTVWFPGRPGVTYFMDALGAIFPEGERFFVRSVKRFRDRIEDERLSEDVKTFMAQEVRHGDTHDDYNRVLAAQGIDLSTFLKAFRAICRIPTPTWSFGLDLSITVAVEHFTAVAARMALRDRPLAGAHPTMQRLFEWHALEELEHKSVAFDVLATTRGSYALRMLGFMLCLTFGIWFVLVPFFWILAKAGKLLSPRVYYDLFLWGFVKERGAWKFWAGLIPYFRPGFHPDDLDESVLLDQFRGELATA